MNAVSSNRVNQRKLGVVVLLCLCSLLFGSVFAGRLWSASGTSQIALQVSADPLPGVLLKTTQVPSVEALLRSHAEFQALALAHGAPPAVVVKTHETVGLGNRLPSVITGFVIALLTRRVFMLDSSLHDYIDLPFPSRWNDYQTFYTNATSCELDFNMWHKADLSGRDAARSLCSSSLHNGSMILHYWSIDYDLPFLQVNPQLQPMFTQLFPHGEVFHLLAAYLLAQPRPAVQALFDTYAADAASCAVGLQIRTRKYQGEGGINVRQFARIAKAAAAARPGSVFVTSDNLSMLQQLPALLRPRRAWWTNVTLESLQHQNQTTAGNPGSEMSAVVDMLLLSRCKEIVVTPSSSFGVVAAGIGGVAPVYATFGWHDASRNMSTFTNPWFWKALSTEPCTFKLATHPISHPAVAAVAANHTLFLQHNQCHHPM